MPAYHAPLDEIRFLLDEVLDAAQLTALPGYEDASPELIGQVLEEAAKLCQAVLQPLNRSGDEVGCRFENGAVTTPPGFPEAYRAYREGGWTGVSAEPEYGGQGLPRLVNFILEEFICSANLSFGIYPGLSQGAADALLQHGSDELKRLYLPRLIDGTWSGTMCLTEAQCGTDLGLIRTRAVPAEDGSVKITGTKIFISAGDHDLTENILHLVLARLPEAPAGIKGISLFLVPKFLPDADGNPGAANGVRCGGIEHKMGIKASATCVINFDDAVGWLVGEPHKGMRAMFTMMNAARLAVGMQGLGIAEVAYQNALAYARERRQGRALDGAKEPEAPADPLIVHPDVRRSLMTMKAYTEGARALAAWVGLTIDLQDKHPDPAKRREAADLVALMTPIVKALLTDLGFEVANLGVQVWGGHGYIRENGMEQFVRDARIAQIYEGANGIQALDLVGRKLPQDMGRLLRRFFHPLAADLESAVADPVLKPIATPLAKAFGKLQQASLSIAIRGLKNPVEAGAASTDYLRLFGLVALGAMWLRMARAAAAGLARGEGQTEFYEAKLKTGHFYAAKLLPQVNALYLAIDAGADPVMALAAEQF